MLKYLKIILEPIKYAKLHFLLFVIFEFFDKFQNVFVVVLMSYIIEALESWNLYNLYYWTGIFIILSIIKLFFSFISDPLFTSTYNDIKFWLEKKYLSKYIQFDNTSVEAYWTWKMNNIIFKWIESTFEILKLFLNVFVEFFAIIYIFILILFKVPNYYYFTWFLLLFLIIIYLFWKWISKIVEIRKESKKLNIEMDNQKVKILMTKFEIFQNQKINHEISIIWNIHKKYKKIWWKWNIKKNLWQVGAEWILQSFYIILFLVIWVWVINWEYNIASFALLVWILQILTRYAWQIRWYMRDIASSFTEVEKLIDIYENIPTYKNDSNLPDFEYKKWDIEFKNIDFSYNKKIKVLDNFNLILQWGKKYALVGESWWGKSTLAKLLSWYINPTKWNIIIDNQKISEVNLKSFYKNIWYLSQEPSVFDWTIIENLIYALDYIPEESKLDEVIKQAKCEFIYELENKLETQIWEKWVRLSWWQKQRLAIGKIMLKNPQIIILDEPTSALDSFNEEHISIALNNLFENKTVIVVAHRLQTVKHSDKIFYIQNGKIIEKWNHIELLKLKWNYFKMIELQSGF